VKIVTRQINLKSYINIELEIPEDQRLFYKSHPFSPDRIVDCIGPANSLSAEDCAIVRLEAHKKLQFKTNWINSINKACKKLESIPHNWERILVSYHGDCSGRGLGGSCNGPGVLARCADCGICLTWDIVSYENQWVMTDYYQSVMCGLSDFLTADIPSCTYVKMNEALK